MFKVISLEFFGHSFFKDLKIQFVPQSEINQSNYISFIIGPNGTGKSKVLLALVSIFNSLDNIFSEYNPKYNFDYKYTLVFENDDEIFTVKYDGDSLLINDFEYYNHIEYLNLPSKTLLSCFSFNDKYPLREQRGRLTASRYHYLGLKSTTNNIFISNPTKAAIGNLYNAILANKDISPLKDAFSILELSPVMKLVYKPGKYFSFLKYLAQGSRTLSTADFRDLFESYIQEKRNSTRRMDLKRLGDEKITRFFDDEMNVSNLQSYLNDHLDLLLRLIKRELSLMPELDLTSQNSFHGFTYHVNALKALSDLEIISFQRFEIKKQRDNFSFDDASSGEYHVIISFLNILSLIENNSLVILDEPEISLHPNWQIRYMEIFDKVFSRFPHCHFIIASHSHFLVSDLKTKQSTIIAMTLDDYGLVETNMLEQNTFGWSAEQILLEVFNVATTRNYYLTRVVGRILKELSKTEPNLEILKREVSELRRLDIDNLNDDDPLKNVIEKLFEKVPE